MSKKTEKKIKEEESKQSEAKEDVALKAIFKKYGNVVSAVSNSNTNIKTISTGSLSLDLALGRGGMALGRIYEVFGPHSGGKSTLAVNVVIQAQRRGLKCAYIDAEHAVDPTLFANYGVDCDDLQLIRAYGGEDNLDILERLVKTGIYDVCVIDSISALLPKVEAEADIDKDHMALLARLMSKAMRKITPIAAETNTLLIWVNQIRMKLGSYGCFHYDTLVNFVDGRSIPIGKVVDDKIQGNVWSFNEETEEIESKPIIGWHYNGDVECNEDFLHIETESIDGGGRFGFTCTPNHEVLTDGGWKKAEDLLLDSKLVSKYKQTVNGTYSDFLAGILVGDSHISIRNKNTGSLRLQDSSNKDYISWKLGKLHNFISFNKVESSFGKVRYDSEYTYEFSKIKRELGRRDPMYLLNNFTAMGFAVWIMDDGNLDLNDGHRRYGLSIKRLKGNVDALEEIKNKFISLGFACKYYIETGFLQFETSETDNIANVICKYVPKCMEYKLPIEYKGKYKEFTLSNTLSLCTDIVRIKEIRPASKKQLRKMRKFDISVKDNCSYMVGGSRNGVVVHNSPETTSGGEALSFFATGRVTVRGPEARSRRIVDSSGEVIGHTAEHEIVKNKLGEPFKKASLRLIYGKGYDFDWEMLDMATSLDIIERAGSWYKYKGENIGHGESSALEKIREDRELFSKVKKEVITTLGLGEQYELHSNPGPLYAGESISSKST
jgi:recombination protein RecA